MPNAVDNAQIIEINQKFYLLIPSRFPPILLYSRIAANRHEEVAAIETLTNPRVREFQRLTQEAGSAVATSPSLQNWNHAPFTYPNPEGSHFFGPETQCLELSEDIETALAVSVAKRELFLSRTTEARIELDMRVLSRFVRGRFVDGRNWSDTLGKEERWLSGNEVLEKGADGLLFRSNERPSGVRIAILNGQTLDRAVQSDHYRFVWDGRRIRSVYSFNSGREIDPATLVNADTNLTLDTV